MISIKTNSCEPIEFEDGRTDRRTRFAGARTQRVHSGLIPAADRMGNSRFSSLSRNALISAGEVGHGVAPSSEYRAFNAGSGSALTGSGVSCAARWAFMPGAPIMAVHEVISYPGSASA